MKVSYLLFRLEAKLMVRQQYVEFSGADFDNDDDVHLPDPNAHVANQALGQSLENLLVSKNRRVLDELTRLRVSYEEVTATLSTAEEQVERLQSEVDRQKGLNEKLENDLMLLNKGGEEKSSGASGAAGLAGLDIGGSVSVSPARLGNDI